MGSWRSEGASWEQEDKVKCSLLERVAVFSLWLMTGEEAAWLFAGKGEKKG